MEPEPTQDLILAALAGDDSAWQRIHERYRRLMLLVLRSNVPLGLRGRFETEDVLQSTFLQVHRELASFEYRGPGSFRHWLVELLRNLLRNRVAGQRALKRDPARETRWTETKAPLDAPRPEERVISAEHGALLLEELAALPEEMHDILVAYFYDGRTAASVAQAHGWSESTFWRRLAAALGELRKRLQDVENESAGPGLRPA